jgi:PAS domain S-box-containing protein
MENIKILLLEDNPHDAELIHHQISKSIIEYEFKHVSELDDFSKAIDDYIPDIILSDYNLIGFTGMDALELARQKCPLTPFIIVTGTIDEETAAETIKKGASDYVVKERLTRLSSAMKNALQLKEEKAKSAIDREKLKISEERYKLSIEGSQDGIWDWNIKTNKVYLSSRWKSMLGYEDHEIENNYKSWEKLLHPDDKEFILATLNKHLKKETPLYMVEVRMKCKDGSYKWIFARGKAMYDQNGNPYRIAGSHTDISERRLMEEKLIEAKEKAEESDHLKTAFLHNISHEIRTPLNAIVGFSGLLNDPDVLPEKRKDFTNIIIKSSDQLLSIITDIVSIASIEAGQEKIHETEININLICKLLNDQFSRNVTNQDITFHLQTILADNEANIVTDATKLTQIITNLLGNALKFTKQGIVNFGYTLKEKLLEFYVEDSGIGIPSVMHTEIFKRFRQVDTTETREYGGSGLGLSISKAYVEMLGGKIWLTSEPNKGSVFYFTLPYKKVSPKEISEEFSGNELNIEFKKLKTFLIAEDEDSNFMFLKELFSDMDIIIIRAMNGLEAVEKCKSNPQIDLVLMDLKMPEMDGLEATKQIKKFRPDLSIIAQTAYSSEEDKNKALACGCSDFIVKPTNRELLLSKINEQLQK